MNTIDIFFALLRSGMYGTPIPADRLPAAIPWKEIVAIAKKQAVYGLIIESVQHLPAGLRPDPALSAEMKHFALGLIRVNTLFDKAAARLVTIFRQHGIEGVLLKGQGIARNYRIPQTRQCGDIDFYVGKRLYRKAVEVSERFIADKSGHHDENEQHFGFSLDGIPIELHRLASKVFTPWRKGRFQRWTEEELERSADRQTVMLDNTPVTIPSCDFDAVYIFHHAWRHYITVGIGLRQLCDWTLLLDRHADTLDREKIAANLRAFGLTKGWKLFGCIAVECLGLDAEKMPLYDPEYSQRSRKVLDDIFEGGNFGQFSRRYAGLPTPDKGLSYGVRKVWPVIQSYVDLIRLIPAEATFLFLDRAIRGSLGALRAQLKVKS